MIGASNQRAGFDVAEPEIAREVSQVGKFIGVYESRHGDVAR